LSLPVEVYFYLWKSLNLFNANVAQVVTQILLCSYLCRQISESFKCLVWCLPSLFSYPEDLSTPARLLYQLLWAGSPEVSEVIRSKTNLLLLDWNSAASSATFWSYWSFLKYRTTWQYHPVLRPDRWAALGSYFSVDLELDFFFCVNWNWDRFLRCYDCHFGFLSVMAIFFIHSLT